MLFDGVCVLCNGFVSSLLKVDRKKKLRFMALQNPKARNLNIGLPELAAYLQDFSTVILIDGGKAFVKSDAILQISVYLPYPWRALKLFKLVPRYLRNKIYDFIAKHRYAWFGRKNHCMIPSPEVEQRIIN